MAKPASITNQPASDDQACSDQAAGSDDQAAYAKQADMSLATSARSWSWNPKTRTYTITWLKQFEGHWHAWTCANIRSA